MAPAVPDPARAPLVNRDRECERFDLILANARQGRGAALVLRGEAGIGKTALLGYAARRAHRWRIIRARGVESEMELPFAGLHQVCAPLWEGLDRLPAPQRNALDTAFGLSRSAPPDRFLIGGAVLSLLSDAAEHRPVLCLVDDVQWLDRLSVQLLAFVCRRLLADSVAVVFATREPSEDFRGLPELVIEGLENRDARALLGSVLMGPLDERVCERIVAETRGNPLALLELPRGRTYGDLAGRFEFSRGLPLSNRIEERFEQRLEPLPPDTRLLLLVAALESVGDVALLSRAAQRLGISLGALDPARRNDLVEVGTQVQFRHPLVRSAVYRAASPSDRRKVHAALAEVTDADLDPDRRAWHRAEATAVPDEKIASELERSAARAQRRGGVAAAAAFLEQATTLTPESARRARRALAAAHVKQLAGAPEAASRLLEWSDAEPLDELARARAQRLRGQLALDLRRPGEALPLLVDAAKRLEALDAGLARMTHLEALRAASVAGRLGPGMVAAARAARTAPPRNGPPHALDLLLDGLAVRFTDGYAAGVSALKRALRAIREEGDRPDQDARWPWLARRVAMELFDDDTWLTYATRSVQIARGTGALAVLPLALNYLAFRRCAEGRLDAAAALLDEADAIAAAMGTDPILFGRLLLAGWRGDEAQALPLMQAGERAAIAQGEGMVLTVSEYARAVLHCGIGDHEAALAPAESASAQDELSTSVWSLPELVEAAARCDRAELAAAALERLSERMRAAGTDLALGIETRSRALLSDGEAADRLYREAIERLGRTRIHIDLARARLLYGEWLRRERRRLAAREQLRSALGMFRRMGAEAFAERAERELLATGAHARKRTVETREQLTPQEAQVARLARDGLSNTDIAARLFMSPRTAEYHLHKIFTKLGISSRNELARALPDAASEAVAP